jgi:hypothetical protein
MLARLLLHPQQPEAAIVEYRQAFFRPFAGATEAIIRSKRNFNIFGVMLRVGSDSCLLNFV